MKAMKNFLQIIIFFFIGSIIVGFSHLDIDLQLNSLIKQNNLTPIDAKPEIDPAKVELGRLLFFDKLLSGNKDISCATCHHPTHSSSDGLPLSIGVGGKGLGEEREMGAGRERIPRNSPDIFNRGDKDWHTMFWDNRVSGSVEEGFDTPAEEKLPEGLENILAVQAMFPVTSRDEMRGEIGDRDVNGETNELALISNASPQIVWHRIMLRILEIPTYKKLFRQVYPEVEIENLGFQHAANAIAAFEIAEFTFNDSPWDNYIAGDLEALSEEAKRGALLFYGKANCSSCHSGRLMTDQLVHNIGVPQLGPGKGDSEVLDRGRFLETGQKEDAFAFRTPSLKNTALTGPWMHNGAYATLEETVRHHLDPIQCLQNYDCDQLPPELRATCQVNEQVNTLLIEKLEKDFIPESSFDEEAINNLVAFLEALTDSSTLHLNKLIPAEVPSGLPVAD